MTLTKHSFPSSLHIASNLLIIRGRSCRHCRSVSECLCDCSERRDLVAHPATNSRPSHPRLSSSETVLATTAEVIRHRFSEQQKSAEIYRNSPTEGLAIECVHSDHRVIVPSATIILDTLLIESWNGFFFLWPAFESDRWSVKTLVQIHSSTSADTPTPHSASRLQAN